MWTVSRYCCMDLSLSSLALMSHSLVGIPFGQHVFTALKHLYDM